MIRHKCLLSSPYIKHDKQYEMVEPEVEVIRKRFTNKMVLRLRQVGVRQKEEQRQK